MCNLRRVFIALCRGCCWKPLLSMYSAWFHLFNGTEIGKSKQNVCDVILSTINPSFKNRLDPGMYTVHVHLSLQNVGKVRCDLAYELCSQTYYDGKGHPFSRRSVQEKHVVHAFTYRQVWTRIYTFWMETLQLELGYAYRPNAMSMQELDYQEELSVMVHFNWICICSYFFVHSTLLVSKPTFRFWRSF